MKKSLIILLVALLASALAACGNNEAMETHGTPSDPVADNGPAIADEVEEETEAETAEETEAPKKEKGYTCEFEEGFSVTIGAVADNLTEIFGEAMNIAEAPSCIHEGTDRIYTYNGFTLTTMPDGKGEDRIMEVSLLSDAVMLKGGVSIGSSAEDVKRLFGEDYTEQFGVLQFKKDGVIISVVLDEDACVSSLVIAAE